MEKRPERVYRTGPWTQRLRMVSLVAICAITFAVLIGYPTLPDVIPTHFTFQGEADGHGARESVLWLSAVMLICAVLLAWLSTKPRSFNYPGTVTRENAQRIYREGERMMVWLLAAVVVIYCGLAVQIFTGAGMVLVVFGLVAMVASVLVGLLRLSTAEDKRG